MSREGGGYTTLVCRFVELRRSFGDCSSGFLLGIEHPCRPLIPRRFVCRCLWLQECVSWMVVRRRLVVSKRVVAISGCREDRPCLHAPRGALRCKPRQKKAFCQDVTCLAIDPCALGHLGKMTLNQANKFPDLSEFDFFLFECHTHGIAICSMVAEVYVRRTCSMWRTLWARFTLTAVICSGSMYRSIPF